MDSIELSDGRQLDIRVTGPDSGSVLVFHHGTPGSGRGFRILEQPAHERGLRVVWMSRPGYGDSSPQPGRSVVDIVSDTAEVLEYLGVDSCVVGGGSSGGPHALACAARLDVAKAVLVVGSHAPFDAGGLDYLAGMGDDNITEYRLALEGEEALRAHLLSKREGLLAASINGFIKEMSSLLPEVDRAVLTDDFGEDVISDVQGALRTGVDGWVDDALAFVRPWGFDLDEITIPTTIWHGSEDWFNPVAHGQWLAANVPRASGHFLEGAGHLSTWQASPSMLDGMLAGTHPRGVEGWDKRPDPSR